MKHTFPFLVATLSILAASPQPTDSADPTSGALLQRCQKTIIKTTQKYLKFHQSKLGKCLEAQAAVDFTGAASEKAQQKCEKLGSAIQKQFDKASAKLVDACQPVEDLLVDPSDPLGLLQYGDCDASVPPNCPNAAELALAYFCFLTQESRYIASFQAPGAFADLGAVHQFFIPDGCLDM